MRKIFARTIDIEKYVSKSSGAQYNYSPFALPAVVGTHTVQGLFVTVKLFIVDKMESSPAHYIHCKN